MEIAQIEIDTLVPYAANARTHSEAQVAQIAASIKEFGFNNPILLADDNTILAGHGRVLASRKLKRKSVPCVYLSHLSETQRKAYMIADNQLALNAGWDMDLLAVEMKGLDDEGFNLSLVGFGEDDLEIMINGLNFAPGTEDDQGRLDQKKPVECPECGHEFTT